MIPTFSEQLKVAHDVGAKGGEASEAERLMFEEWMRGHCWALSAKWDGKQYMGENESVGQVDAFAMHTRQLWAAWRDCVAVHLKLADMVDRLPREQYTGKCADLHKNMRLGNNLPDDIETWGD